MIVAMSVQTLYNLVDAIWVSGLGADALAAVGFVFPLLFMGIAIATGLGIGGGAAISRRIGARDKTGADSAAVHTLLATVVLAVLYTIPLFLFTEDIFQLIGAGRTTATATLYARIMYSASIVTFFSFVANAILRSEGDAKRAMVAMVLGGILNVILDPIFIYVLQLGVPGAAWASVVSMIVSASLLFYWLFHKKDTYVAFHFRGFRFNRHIMKDILIVGLPASVMQLSMSIMMFLMNVIIGRVGGIDAIAVFAAGWRVATMASMPMLGMATAVVSVTGAAYGARAYTKLNTAYIYAVKIGLVLESGIAVATFLSAPLITAAFTQSADTARIGDDITTFLRIICVFYPATAFGILSSAVFQGVGKGIYSLLTTVFRTIVLILPLAWVFSTVLEFGLVGAWWGLVTANIIGGLISFTWVTLHIRGLLKKPLPPA
ncbi:MAG: MATE family efflux transporter [Candidatus Thermoplasmatota archaeon]|nr:MATE family efflux transporter [Candidatus Thermoplasmatota archaeon]